MMKWIINGISNYLKKAATSAYNNRVDDLTDSKEFRELHKQFGMNEEEFANRANKMIKEDPKKFNKILSYDVRKGRYGKYFN